MDRCTEYANKVVNGKLSKYKGLTEKLCCQRHLDDLIRSESDDFEFYFDVEESEKYISIANTLTIAEGETVKPLKTRGFQDFIIGSIHGWKNKETGFVRYREAYIQMARQNGKSFIAGTEGNSWATFTGYQEGRIICGATKQDQANIVYDELKKFIKSDKYLSKMYKIIEYKHEIVSKVTNTKIKAVGRDTKSLDGFRSILAIVDEYHAHPNNQMYALLRDGQINVDNACTLAITTAGFTINGPCHLKYQFCKQVLEGAVEKDSQFIFICELDKDDDITDPLNWCKSSPFRMFNEDDTINEKMVQKIQDKSIEAQETGGSELVNFMTKELNIWVSDAGDKLLDYDAFIACGNDTTLDDMVGRDCILGIDLASSGDLTSIALLFPLDDGKVFIHQHSFLPIEGVQRHVRDDGVPYEYWSKEGLIDFTTGGGGIKTDYSYIVGYLKELIRNYNINVVDCGYDPHNAGGLLAELDFLGCDLTMITQSARNLSDATKDFRLTVKGDGIRYNKNDKLFMWCCSNAITTTNSFGEEKVDKTVPTQRIDPVDACLDAWYLHFNNRLYDTDVNKEIDEWSEMMGLFNK